MSYIEKVEKILGLIQEDSKYLDYIADSLNISSIMLLYAFSSPNDAESRVYIDEAFNIICNGLSKTRK